MCVKKASEKIFISGCYDGSIKKWDIETGELMKTLGGHNGEILSLVE